MKNDIKKADKDQAVKELNDTLKKYGFIHPNMKVKEYFTFDTFENFMAFIDTQKKFRRIYNTKARGSKRFIELNEKISEKLSTILLYNYNNAKNKEEKEKYRKIMNKWNPIFFNSMFTTEQWMIFTDLILKDSNDVKKEKDIK